MRVIAGKWRGRPLAAPQGRTTRPITDRVKETLFNILGSRLGTLAALPACAVLDCFAGSGALGIEALSRGASSCLFIERDRAALRCLRENLSKLNAGAAARLSAENAWTMRVPPPDPPGYGLIFLDPPYADVAATTRLVDLLDRLGESLAPGGLLVLRCALRDEPPVSRLRTLRAADERVIGTMRLTLFEPRSADI